MAKRQRTITVVMALIAGLVGGVASWFFVGSMGFAQDLWWISEYPTLIKKVNDAPNRTLTTSCRTGPEGQRKVTISISRKKGKGLVLETKLPKESVFTIYETTGRHIPSKTNPVVTIRDLNLDGMPEDFTMKPGLPPDDAIFSQDGFVTIKNTDEYRAIMIKWLIGIGFSVNHFLHGVDSAFPR